MKQALEQANYTAGKDSLYINAHGTGTKLNDSSETTAIKLALGEEDAKRARISSTKSMTGHMLGAAGAVELIASALALQNGVIPPDHRPGAARPRLRPELHAPCGAGSARGRGGFAVAGLRRPQRRGGAAPRGGLSL